MYATRCLLYFLGLFFLYYNTTLIIINLIATNPIATNLIATNLFAAAVNYNGVN